MATVTTEKPALKLFESTTKYPKGVIGYLYGPVANYREPTLNGIFYNEAYWDELMSSPKFKRFLKQKKYIGELSHPRDDEDRIETELTEGCIILLDLEKKSDGYIYGKFLIMDVEDGWKTRTYFEVGSELGVSFRGSGQTSTDFDGTEVVIPGSSDFKGFDIVRDPAVESSVLKLLESRRDNAKRLGVSLIEELESEIKGTEQKAKEYWNSINEQIKEDFSYFVANDFGDIVIFLKGHKDDPDKRFTVNFEMKHVFDIDYINSIAGKIIGDETTLTEDNQENKTIHETDIVVDPENEETKAFYTLDELNDAGLIGSNVYQCPVCMTKLVIKDIHEYEVEEDNKEQTIIKCPKCSQTSVLSNDFNETSFKLLGTLFPNDV